MASGHAYRANRPNTWLHRPMLQSEDSPCQPGAVHTWPLADISMRLADFRFGSQADILLQRLLENLGEADTALLKLLLHDRPLLLFVHVFPRGRLMDR